MGGASVWLGFIVSIFWKRSPRLSPEACLEKGVDRPRNDINIPRNKKTAQTSPFLYPLTIATLYYKKRWRSGHIVNTNSFAVIGNFVDEGVVTPNKLLLARHQGGNLYTPPLPGPMRTPPLPGPMRNEADTAKLA